MAIKQGSLFDEIGDVIDNQFEHWIDMPEFNQEKKKPYKELIIRFRNECDYQEFSKLINQKLTIKTKSLWFPELERGLNSALRYVDES